MIQITKLAIPPMIRIKSPISKAAKTTNDVAITKREEIRSRKFQINPWLRKYSVGF